MANTASARKRIRQTATRTARNKARVSRMRTFIRKVEEAISGGDREQAATALRVAQPEMQRAVGKGVAHRNTIARRISRLSARIKGLSKLPRETREPSSDIRWLHRLAVPPGECVSVQLYFPGLGLLFQ